MKGKLSRAAPASVVSRTEEAAEPDEDLDPEAQDDEEEGGEEEAGKLGDEALLEIARKRFKLAADAEQEIRAEALSDLRFAAGDQWDPELKAQREQDHRPTVVMNRMPGFIRQITNERRQNKTAIKVDPVDDKADPEIAKVKQGLLRHIQVKSRADIAYNRAFESAVRMGFGYWRVRAVYCDPMSFNQELVIESIANALKVYKDPGSTEPDGRDAEFYFISEDLEEDEFRDKYPSAECVSADDFAGRLGDEAPLWRGTSTIRVVEYLYKAYRKTRICLLSTGHVVEAKVAHVALAKLPKGTKVVKERETKVPTVRWAKLTGAEVLEHEDTVFDLWLPVVPVIGEELDVDGKKIIKGVVRDAKDAQRLLNFFKSGQAETIGLAPRAPYVAEAKQIEGYEEVWATANTKNHSFLPYNAVDVAGVAVPPPQRQTYEPAVQATTQAAEQADEDLKKETGIFDAGVGARSNEQSGRAIDARRQQIATSNYHFTDNMNFSLEHTGRILLRAMPRVYDTARVERIVNEDGTVDQVALNQPTKTKSGQEIRFDMDVGDYDVVCDTGPSFATKRQEGAAAIQDMFRSVPKAAEVAGDLYARAIDAPYADEIAKRIKKTLPPGVADDENGQQEIPPQVKAELDKASHMVATLSAANQALLKEREMKMLELQSKERIAMEQIKSANEIALLKAQSAESVALLNAQISEIQHRIDTYTELSKQPPAGADPAAPDAGASPDVQGSGADGAVQPETPTGGPTPGQSMEQP